MSAAVLTAIASAITTVIVTGLARGLMNMRKEFHQFMTEHLWLLDTTRRNSDTIEAIQAKIGMVANEATRPPDLP